MSLGTLVVELTANVAKFQSDLGRAEQIAQNTARRIDAQFAIVKTAIAGFGVGIASLASLDAIVGKFESVVGAAAGLQQLSERTGASVESLSALTAVAKLSGTESEQLATGLQKLSRAMLDAEQGGVKTSAAFKTLGISTQGLAAERPDEVFVRIAMALSNYQDGAAKTALAQELLGKSGANLLPVMKDLAETGDLQVRVTAEQARVADEYEKNLVRLKLATDAIFKKIGLELVPVINAFTKATLESISASDGLRSSVDTLASGGTLRLWAERAAMGLAYLVDILSVIPAAIGVIVKSLRLLIDEFVGLTQIFRGVGQALGGDFAQGAATAREALVSMKGDARAWARDMQSIWSQPLFSDRLRQELEASHRVMTGTSREKLPALDLSGDKELLKKQLDAELRLLDRQIQQESRALQMREQLLSRAFSDEQISTRDYYAAKAAIGEEALSQTLALYDRELAALRRYAREVGDAKAQLEARTKISEIDERKQALINDAQSRSVLLTLDEAKATRAYRDEIERLNVRLLELEGHLSEAAQRQQRLQDRPIRERLTIEGDAQGLAVLDALERLSNARAQFSELTSQAALIEERLGTAEARVGAQRQAGVMTELSAMAQVSIARRQAAEDLVQIAKRMRELAEQSADPRLIEGAIAFQARIEQLVAASDELGTKFRLIFEDHFAGFFTELVTGAKSFKDVFLDMARSIEQAITRIVAQNLAQRLFGEGGALGGASKSVSGFLNRILGSVIGGVFGAPSAPTSPVTLPGRASGGPVYSNQAYLVGERGPEVFVPSTAGQIVANASGMSAPANVVIHNHFAAGTDLRTIDQAATQIGQRVQRALRRSI